MITVNAITCPFCKATIYSRANHDFRSCPCGKYSIDGGFEYTRLLFPTDTKKMPECFQIEVNATKEELYRDWNNRQDKFGIILPDIK